MSVFRDLNLKLPWWLLQCTIHFNLLATPPCRAGGLVSGNPRAHSYSDHLPNPHTHLGIFSQRFASDRGSMDEHGGMGDLRRFTEARAMKTGTTIAGVVFEGGVVLGADTRATGGQTVCDRNCDKIHILAANIACCGAGTSVDAVRITEGVRIALSRMALDMQACLPSRGLAATRMTSSATVSATARTIKIEDGVEESVFRHGAELEAVQRQHGRVASAAYLLKRHLFRYQGVVSAALVLGGIDAEGAHIYQIQQGGSLDKVLYTAMGSGSLAALSVLERGHRAGLGEEGAKQLVIEAIAAGIDNDLGSGSNIDLCIMSAGRGLEHHRGVWKDPGLMSKTNKPWRTANGKQGSASANANSDAVHGSTGPENIVEDENTSIDDLIHIDMPPRAVDGRVLDAVSPKPMSHTLVGMEDENVLQAEGKEDSEPAISTIRKRHRKKKVVRVDDNGEGLASFRCSAIDDRIEVL